MKRLTKRTTVGAASYDYPPDCYFDNGMDEVAKSGFRQNCVERLAAYEDTGLTPKEVKRMSNILMDVGIDYNCSWEYVKNWLLDNRLRELAEADKDGRVVVLPCKMGDTVYYIRREFDGTDVVGEAEFWWSDIPYIGKTIFITREEAEKALEERKGNEANHCLQVQV